MNASVGKAYPCAKGFLKASAPPIPTNQHTATVDRHRVSLGLYTEVEETKLRDATDHKST